MDEQSAVDSAQRVSPGAERLRQLETVLAGLIDHIDHVGCYDDRGERLGNQVPAVYQARLVLGDEAWRRVWSGAV